MTDPTTVTVIDGDLPKVYDEAFTVRKQRWGTFVSYDLKGSAIITSLSLDKCVAATSWYLKAKQDGFESSESRTYEGTVGSKL